MQKNREEKLSVALRSTEHILVAKFSAARRSTEKTGGWWGDELAEVHEENAAHLSSRAIAYVSACSACGFVTVAHIRAVRRATKRATSDFEIGLQLTLNLRKRTAGTTSRV